MVTSILDRAADKMITHAPFPHLQMKNALAPEYYQELAANFPDLEFIAGAGRFENNRIYLKAAAEVVENPLVPEIWREFFKLHTSHAFFDQFISQWKTEIEHTHPDLEQNFGKPLAAFNIGMRAIGKREAAANFEHDLVLDCVFGIHSPVKVSTPARGPHVDSGRKLFSALIYFRDAADDCKGGEFEIYRLSKGVYPRFKMKKIPHRFVDRVGTVPYAENTLVVWLNGAESIHGVSPRSVTELPRRYVAITGECYGGKIRDYFNHHPEWERPIQRLRYRLKI